MNEPLLKPTCESDLVDAIASCEHVVAIGNRTKPAMSPGSGVTLVSLSAMTGIIEYEPSEFTFTARSGTRIDEVRDVLSERNQYLPFDPMLVDAGATLGGTVASGLSGPGRFRFGGVRDFIIGCVFVSGDGKVIRSGGKVVKNAAGFDIPKLMVGSLGRLGVMTELTFKVFPKPLSTLTLSVACESYTQLIDRIQQAASSRWELDAIDARPNELKVLLRIAGPQEANQAIASEITSRWTGDVSELESCEAFWHSVTELTFAPHRSHVVKVPTASTVFSSLDHHVSAAGNVTWIATDDVTDLDAKLTKLGVPGLVVRGEWSASIVGKIHTSHMSRNIKTAMEPHGRFPG
ncbi:putative FAD-linked oxidoreductase [Rubripirellula tenax]|uniref:Putative FAD-linked oxidoreductase n=1 Tax=Rubripirellula tenax TaxID=2528015 RepID=A0A5C6FIK8_9BACT|nr:FAD-binding protein [Rubripirellula tenax]TWU60423.1 putative FAD-linked oxidoreductase [Rubripirellula tenax]